MSFRQHLANGALLTLMLGHFTNDMFAGVLPVLYPVMKDRFDLDNATVGLATLAYTGTASLSQPFFGYLSDRYARRWFAPAILLWSSCFVAAYGYASSYGAFLTLAALAGIGSGAYHPLGASNAAAVTEEGARNSALSMYTVGGTTGYALGPLVAVLLLALFGAGGTVLLLAPGVAAASLLMRQMGRVARAREARRRTAVANTLPAGRTDWGALGRVIGLTMLRSWVFLAVIQFAPLWYDDQGYGRAFYGPLVTVIILAGAVGTLAGGVLADRIGQRRVMVGSLVFAIPALLLFVGLPGPLAFLTGALFGVICDSSLSVTLVAAQRLLPGRTGIASGVVLGLGFITGGVGVPITGQVADAVGYPAALGMLSGLLMLGALLGLSLPAGAASSAGSMAGRDREPVLRPEGRSSTIGGR